MLEQKLKNAIDQVNDVMTDSEVATSDQGKDVMRSVVRGGTGFENTFDRIIKSGKKEGIL